MVHGESSLIAEVVSSHLEVALCQVAFHLDQRLDVLVTAVAVLGTECVQIVENSLKDILLFEVVQEQWTVPKLVHRGAGVARRRDLVRIKFLPYAPWDCDVPPDTDLTHELAVISASADQSTGEVEVIGTDNWTFHDNTARPSEVRSRFEDGVGLVPALLGITHPMECSTEAVDLDVLDLHLLRRALRRPRLVFDGDLRALVVALDDLANALKKKLTALVVLENDLADAVVFTHRYILTSFHSW